MPTLRDIRAPLNPDGSIDYYALQAQDRTDKFNARGRELNEVEGPVRDPYTAIMNRYAGRRAMLDESSPLRPYEGPAGGSPPAGLMTGEETAALDARVMEGRKKPTHVYATNIDETEAKWKGEGKAVRKIKEPPPVPPKPTEDDLISREMTDGMWVHILERNGWTTDPRTINAAEYAAKKRKEWEDSNPEPDPEKDPIKYKRWEKLANQIYTDNLHEMQEAKTTANVEYNHLVNFTRDKRHIEEAKEAKRMAQEAKVEKEALAQSTTQRLALNEKTRVMNNWRNYDLTQEQLNKIANLKKGQTPVLGRSVRLRQDILNNLNSVLTNAGLPPIKMGETEVNTEEFDTFFGFEVPWTRRTTDRKVKVDTSYIEDPNAKPTAQPQGSMMSEEQARKALTAKGVTGKDQDYWINEYKANGKVR